ncbi:MAG: hypothetical protein H8E34_10885 [Bacteroidetes bacterium]|nr:hypothetical protein [Bacteroidota bacterium]
MGVIKQELERIANDNNGVLKPIDIVNEASNKDSVLHSKFEWDDTEAAHQYRLEQARRLIRVVVNIINTNKPDEYRVWVSLSKDRTNKDGGYKAITSVLVDQDESQMLLDDAKKEMKHFTTKYRMLKELANVINEMNKVL